eukprot:INCI17165.15.p1 GENE.INCI17165.15~~INCI17165.15.p1  ORF type:complete len:681 (+),score=100.10 INCI17165.15:190-2232(+)
MIESASQGGREPTTRNARKIKENKNTKIPKKQNKGRHLHALTMAPAHQLLTRLVLLWLQVVIAAAVLSPAVGSRCALPSIRSRTFFLTLSVWCVPLLQCGCWAAPYQAFSKTPALKRPPLSGERANSPQFVTVGVDGDTTSPRSSSRDRRRSAPQVTSDANRALKIAFEQAYQRVKALPHCDTKSLQVLSAVNLSAHYYFENDIPVLLHAADMHTRCGHVNDALDAYELIDHLAGTTLSWAPALRRARERKAVLFAHIHDEASALAACAQVRAPSLDCAAVQAKIWAGNGTLANRVLFRNLLESTTAFIDSQLSAVATSSALKADTLATANLQRLADKFGAVFSSVVWTSLLRNVSSFPDKTPLGTATLTALLGQPETRPPCDVVQLDASAVDSSGVETAESTKAGGRTKRALMELVHSLISRGVPFVLRGVAHEWNISAELSDFHHLRSKCASANVTQRHSRSGVTDLLRLSAAGFGGEEQLQGTLHDTPITVAHFLDRLTVEADGMAANASYDPPYVLSRIPPCLANDGAYEIEATRDWFPPSLFNDEFGASSRYNSSLLYLGPRDSGTNFHSHKAAWNVLFRGEKHWLLFPPSEVEGVGPPWFHQESVRSWFQKNFRWAVAHGALQCTQLAGDVMYIPGHWQHAVINTQTVAGFTQQTGIAKNMLQNTAILAEALIR